MQGVCKSTRETNEIEDEKLTNLTSHCLFPCNFLFRHVAVSLPVCTQR